jgi:trimeric autotransporter adhesin
MKAKVYFLVIAALLITATTLSLAQPSNKINYQAVARSSSGAILANQTVGLRLTVENGPGGPVIYQERQTPTTNQFGLLTVQIGGGTPLVGTYNSIDWSMSNIWLLVDMDPTGNTSYTTMGESQFLSVPYAIRTLTSDMPSGTNGQTLRHNGTTWIPNSNLYNDGTNIGISQLSPASKLHVKGGANVPQLIVDAYSGQTAAMPLIKLRDASGVDLFWINPVTASAIYLGFNSGASHTSATNNTILGYYSGKSITMGGNNTAMGSQALMNDSSGANNTAIGVSALQLNKNGDGNIAIGSYALSGNVGGRFSTAVGYSALMYGSDTAAAFSLYNTAVGYQSMQGALTASGNSGRFNTALGATAMKSYSTGALNTAIGYGAMLDLSSGNSNTAVGSSALYNDTTGSNNVAVGTSTLNFNANGSSNVAIGYAAGLGASATNFTNCTFVGSTSYPTVTRSNVTMLGYAVANAQCTADNQICLGNTSVTQIRAQVGSITTYSDARIKRGVKENVEGLSFINKLRPVTYYEHPETLHEIWGTPDSLYKTIDHSQINNTRMIGFLAQDVEKAANESGFDFPGIDVPRNDKEVYALRYGDFIMPLVKAVQELSKENGSLKEEIAQLKVQVSGFVKNNCSVSSASVK